MTPPPYEQAIWAHALATELRERAQQLTQHAPTAAIARLYREANKFDLLAARLEQQSARLPL
jgi:hypothetical protein